MILKSKPLPINVIRFVTLTLAWLYRRRFNKMTINEAEIKPGHSYLLMCNHFSFWDGFFAFYLCFKSIHKQHKLKKIYIMSVKKQIEKNWWLRYAGSFSIVPGSRSVDESLNYAAEKLSEPGNILLYYPQGNLESLSIRRIEFKDGVYEIVTRIKGNCQLIWSSNLIEYFESIKPSVQFNMLDCGTNNDFDFEELKQKVNKFHLEAMARNVRFTKEIY